MIGSPRVSIVVPLFNDDEHVAAALESCLAQTLREIEIICVDDASTDTTVEIVEKYQQRDDRVRLIRQPSNLSAFQARRAGIAAASAPYILFLDGDDELSPDAARAALRAAKSRGADVVGFGVEIVTKNSPVPRRFEAALQPQFDELLAPHIVPSLFPAGEVANGHLWRYLFASSLLQRAYEALPADLTFYRANDLPISFLALIHAAKYVSVSTRLYRYHFRRGTSGHAVDGLDYFRFLLSGIDPITAVRGAVVAAVDGAGSARATLESYESARLHMIGNVLRNCIRDTSGELQTACLDLLRDKVGSLDLVRAAAAFCPEALSAISRSTEDPSQPALPVRSVLLTTAHLDTGGLQSVLIDHALRLNDAGYRVTIGVLRDTPRDVALPNSIDIVVLTGSMSARLDQLTALCHDHEVDVIIDHHILYNDTWPWFALAALATGVPMIGWVHNFSLRPIFDHTQRASFIALHAHLLLKLVTLSPIDVAFWKLQGVDRAIHLPNPPSPFMLAALAATTERTYDSGRLELAWWGRLDGPTKQVDHLVRLAAELHARDVDFRLRVIGPDSKNLTSTELRELAVERGVAEFIEFIGERSAEDLITDLSDAHLFVSTSAIEGYQLTILEAQALGIPVVMYDLPWLATVRGNRGLIATPADEPGPMADAITRLAGDRQRYADLSLASRTFARALAGTDIQRLLVGMLTDDLPTTFSPTPSTEDARILVQWLVRYSERSIRTSLNDRSDYSRLRSELKVTRSQLRQIREGPSYRLGRFLTLIPRRVRSFLASAQSRHREAP